MRRTAADAATEIEDGLDAADQLLRKLDLVTGEIIAVAVEELRLRGEDCLVLSGVLVEIDA